MNLDSKKPPPISGRFLCKQIFSEALHGVFFSGMFLILSSLAASLLLGKARLSEKKNPAA